MHMASMPGSRSTLACISDPSGLPYSVAGGSSSGIAAAKEPMLMDSGAPLCLLCQNGAASHFMKQPLLSSCIINGFLNLQKCGHESQQPGWSGVLAPHHSNMVTLQERHAIR